MKKLIILVTLVTTALVAQVPTPPPATLWPFGAWVLCGLNIGLTPGFPVIGCNDPSQTHPYLLGIYGDPLDTTTFAYQWVVTGTRIDTGESVVRTGSALRSNNGYGYTDVGIDFGGPIKSCQITIIPATPGTPFIVSN